MLAYCYGCKTTFHSQKALTQHLNHSSKQECGVKHISNMLEFATTSTMPIALETNQQTQILVNQKDSALLNLNKTATNNRLIMQSMQSQLPGTFNYPGIMQNSGEFYNHYDHDTSQDNFDSSSHAQFPSSVDDNIDSISNIGDDVEHEIPQENITPPSNSYLFERMIRRKEKIEVIRDQVTWSNQITAALELEQILHKSGAPLGLFDKVMAWATENQTSLPERTLQLSRTRLYNTCREKMYSPC